MKSTNGKIAVIGMSCRFPGAKNLDEYWSNLINGIESINHFTDVELRDNEIDYEELKNNPNFVPARGIINDVDKFDATFFGFTPDEASLMDPQHRLWLETVWSGFENACVDPGNFKGNIGVYAGGYSNTYLLNNVLRTPLQYENYIRLRTTESFRIAIANDITHLPTKTAYLFNLKGPAVNVQTACSTSLVAIAQACNSLYSYESDICVAGGVAILVPQESGYIYQEGAIPSPDGHCRPFDEKGQGTVFSNGLGVVILKRIEDAIKDKDHIYAVVDGWAINNDGNKKVSYTAPSIQGQEEVILMAHSFAGVKAEDFGYIEAHGTATNLGDPIEIKALSNAFSRTTNKKQFCGIGSVKSNIGHTDAAAGVASFIKICLAAYHKAIPPTINFEKPNPHIKFEESPFYVNDKLKKWESNDKLVIGVSSFGIGGTNAHVIIEEPPRSETNTFSRLNKKIHVLPISAKTKTSLKDRQKQLIEFLHNNKTVSLSDVCQSLWYGRSHMPYRNTIIADSIDQIISNNYETTEGKVIENITGYTFTFPGQGAQFVNMGKGFYEENDTFKEIVDQGFYIFEKETGKSLQSIVFPNEKEEDAESILAKTSYTQPALFILEFATAKVLLKEGITPDYLIGHSIGEYAAATVAGVFDFETALKIVIKRGQLMQDMPTGEMFAVNSTYKTLNEIKGNYFEIAAENAPESCTISFSSKDIKIVEEILDKYDIKYIHLNTSHAFHSKAFDPILKEFEFFVDQCISNPPQIPFISCYTGDFISDTDAISGSYWAKQLRNTVFFGKGVSKIQSLSKTLFIEVGPNSHLSGSIKYSAIDIDSKTSILTIGRPENNFKNVIQRIKGNIWCYTSQEFNDFFPDSTEAKKIPLPTYPFEKKRHWIEYKYEKNKSIVSENVSANTRNFETGDDITNMLLSIWRKRFGREDINLTDNFLDMGGESMLAFSLIADIEKHLKVHIPFRDFIGEYNTLDKVSTFVKNKIAEKEKSKTPEKANFEHLYCIKAEGKSTPIFGIFSDTILEDKDLSKNNPVYDFVWPGSDGRPLKMRTFDEIVQTYLEEILKIHPGRSYYLMGFSFGGLLAFEIAIRLQKMGMQVPLLVMFDSANPITYKYNIDLQGINKKILKYRFSKVLIKKVISAAKHQINVRLEKAKIYLLFKLNRKLPANLTQANIYNETSKISQSYHPGFFEGKVYLFRSTDDMEDDEFLGWKNHTTDIQKYQLDVSHTQIKREKNNILFIREELKKIINEIEA